MKKDEIIALLQQLVDSLKAQNEDLLHQVAILTEEVSSLRQLLVEKGEQEAKQKRIIKGLSKLQANESERQNAPVPSSTEKEEGQETKPRVYEKTNHGAMRKEHYEVETVEEDVYPDDPRYDAMKARLVKTRDVIRYRLIPMRFIKTVYHVHIYSQDGEIMQGKAPDAPFLNSQYDGSFIAGMAQLRYIYSMPVERIVRYFSENGFDMDKATANGLLAKSAALFENLHRAIAMAVRGDDYKAGDETYHKVLVETKNSKGRHIKKGYIWCVEGVRIRLVYFFYHDGSRAQEVIHDYIGDSTGAFQSDGYTAYRNMEKKNVRITRLACLQHVKRKFLDCGNDFDCKVIVRLINHLYHQEHKHVIDKDGWTERKNYRWRQQYAKPTLKILRKKLDRMAADPLLLPKTEKHDAVHYMLNEWKAIENIFTRGDYHLDNNEIERLNRYVSLSRRNSMFFGSHAGAERGAIFYSLSCSCRLNGINFFEYIADVLNRFASLPPNTPIERYRNLLPDKWKESR